MEPVRNFVDGVSVMMARLNEQLIDIPKYLVFTTPRFKSTRELDVIPPHKMPYITINQVWTIIKNYADQAVFAHAGNAFLCKGWHALANAQFDDGVEIHNIYKKIRGNNLIT